MSKNKGYSKDLTSYYHQTIKAILAEMDKSDEPHYTHWFENLEYSLAGKDNRPHLLKCLWTLVERGDAERIALGCHIYKWKITEQGKQYLQEHTDKI